MGDLVGEEEGYSDDDLDALPDNTFHTLQEDAIRSTQQADRYALPQLPPSHTTHQHALAQPSSDYGDFDDEMLDGEIFDAAEQPNLAANYEGGHIQNEPGESTQREQWRQQRYGQPHQSVAHQGNRNVVPTQAARNGPYLDGTLRRSRVGPGGRELYQAESRKEGAQPVQESPDVAALQAQVQKLLNEREQLQQAVKTANDSAFAKAGEIAIVRANAYKIEKEFESRTKTLQKLHEDEAFRQKIEVERARAELQKIATEKDFLENDLAEGTKQIRTLQRAVKKGDDKAAEKESTVTTPKKNKLASYGDGFDNNEIQPLSPSKLALRSKAGTPKAGAKRKRKPLDDSPARALQLAQPIQTESFEEPVRQEEAASKVVNVQPVREDDQKFQFTQRILNHRIRCDEDRTLEALATYNFPSQPGKPLSTMLLDKMSPVDILPGEENLPAAVALIVVSLWSRCIKEKYHEPVHLLIDLVKYILVTNPLKVAPDLTNSLMSLLQETADILIIPRCQKKPPRPDRAEISSTECLQVIYTMASDCSISPDELTRFWRTMRFDFIMMLLSFVHPLPELHLTISLLCTSILPSTFAMIIPPGDGKQDTTEARVIDNLSRLLVESPRATANEPHINPTSLSALRLEILDLMDHMCSTDYGASALARHRLVIGRLVRVMNDELDQAYNHQHGHGLRISLVNAATRLLHHLTDNCPHLINIQDRLGVIPGGEKKFLIVLTRLAFSEGGLLEGGIEDDVVDCAHQMLEARVSPEEAEGLVGAFSSAPATGGTRSGSRREGEGGA